MGEVMVMARARALVFGVVAACAAWLIGACSPGQRDTLRDVAPRVVPPITEAVCFVLRRHAPSGAVGEICATADDILPFFDEIVSLREARQVGAPQAPALAFILAEPTRPVARRRCLAWEERRSDVVGDAGGGDSGR